MILIKHVALVCASEDNSDRFYGDLLGLDKLGTKAISSERMNRIFRTEGEYRIADYSDGNVHFEIFIGPQPNPPEPKVDHVCLGTPDLESFLQKCRSLRVRILEIPRDTEPLVFIWDLDSNIFEVKEAK